jgi:hypothetical protein
VLLEPWPALLSRPVQGPALQFTQRCSALTFPGHTRHRIAEGEVIALDGLSLAVVCQAIERAIEVDILGLHARQRVSRFEEREDLILDQLNCGLKS